MRVIVYIYESVCKVPLDGECIWIRAVDGSCDLCSGSHGSEYNSLGNIQSRVSYHEGDKWLTLLVVHQLTISNEYIFSEVGVITTGEVTVTGVGGHIIEREALNIKC